MPKQGIEQKSRQTSDLIGISKEADRIREFAKEVAFIEDTVLIQGETGVGKNLLAELIHNTGRSDKAFVSVNCGALPVGLWETELLGHVKGAYTGALVGKQGLIQIAEGGTIFFNEAMNMSLDSQAKFLPIFEKETFRVVGGTEEIQINTRIIVATNADLELAVSRGELRLDLYHRLNVIAFTIAPLRNRTDDIPALVEYFIQQKKKSKKFSPEALAVLKEYKWPGNVRELNNVVTQAILHSREEDIKPEHIFPHLTDIGENSEKEFPSFYEHEEKYWRKVLEKSQGSYSRGEKFAKVAAQVIRYKVQRFQLQDLVASLKKK